MQLADPVPARGKYQARIRLEGAEWEQNCPENFGNRAAPVGAEIARIEGRELSAQRFYEKAIRSARENGFAQNEGIANELAAKFYLASGFETSGYAYLSNARDCYLRWGALGKVWRLDQCPGLREESPHRMSILQSARASISLISVR